MESLPPAGGDLALAARAVDDASNRGPVSSSSSASVQIPDVYAPSAVADLKARFDAEGEGDVGLAFTAPGDDFGDGTRELPTKKDFF